MQSIHTIKHETKNYSKKRLDFENLLRAVCALHWLVLVIKRLPKMIGILNDFRTFFPKNSKNKKKGFTVCKARSKNFSI